MDGKPEFFDREEDVEKIVDEIGRRAVKLKGKEGGSDKAHSPALLVAQAPGAGKSHFLAMLGEQIPALYDFEGREKKWPIVSAFTYNSGMLELLGDERIPGIPGQKVDLGLRVLYGAAAHMNTSMRCCSWSGFLTAFRCRSSKSLQAELSRNLRLVLEILRVWYGARPVVILADEVGKSQDERIIRHELCNTMDIEAGQAFVVMSALSNYERLKEMFNESNREHQLLILSPLHDDASDMFTRKMKELDRGRFGNTSEPESVQEYKIRLAWGCTGGYARALERLAHHIEQAGRGLDGPVIRNALDRLARGGGLPPDFVPEELERVLEVWDDRTCLFNGLADTLKSSDLLAKALYKGSVLLETAPSQKVFPTVAPWHAARFLQQLPLAQRQPGWGECPRCGRLMEVVGKAYMGKFTAIDQEDDEKIKQASAYFTETTAVLGIMFAMVRQSAELPRSLLQVESRSILDIGFDDTFSQDSDLATARKDSEETAQQKLSAFLRRAVQRGQNKSMPFLIIAAPPACKAVDFVILGPGLQDLTAVQVKSGRAVGQRNENRLCNALARAWNVTRNATEEAGISNAAKNVIVNFLAVVGSDLSAEASANIANGGIHALQRKDLVEHIPPFLRHLSGLAAGAD